MSMITTTVVPPDAREHEEAIVRALGWFMRTRSDAVQRSEKAADRGAELAAVVYRYLQAPGETGRAALREAYGRFMAAHAGNFGPDA